MTIEHKCLTKHLYSLVTQRTLSLMKSYQAIYFLLKMKKYSKKHFENTS